MRYKSPSPPQFPKFLQFPPPFYFTIYRFYTIILPCLPFLKRSAVMNDNSKKKRTIMIVGSVVGALLGAGAAYLLMTAPAEAKPGKEPEPITGGDVLALTGAAAVLIRKLDDFRRRL
jgi:hypothetical protein